MCHCVGGRSIEEERTDAKYAISVSIVEIYNEMVHDLLADEGKADPELQKGPNGFTIPDLTRSGTGARACVRSAVLLCTCQVLAHITCHTDDMQWCMPREYCAYRETAVTM